MGKPLAIDPYGLTFLPFLGASYLRFIALPENSAHPKS